MRARIYIYKLILFTMSFDNLVASYLIYSVGMMACWASETYEKDGGQKA